MLLASSLEKKNNDQSESLTVQIVSVSPVAKPLGRLCGVQSEPEVSSHLDSLVLMTGTFTVLRIYAYFPCPLPPFQTSLTVMIPCYFHFLPTLILKLSRSCRRFAEFCLELYFCPFQIKPLEMVSFIL